jgi:hypothetical protein
MFNDSYAIYNGQGDKIAINQKNLDPDFTDTSQSREGSEDEQWVSV